MWRKFPARVHADAGVDLEIFRRAGSLHDVICGAKTRDDSSHQWETLATPRFCARAILQARSVAGPFLCPPEAELCKRTHTPNTTYAHTHNTPHYYTTITLSYPIRIYTCRI
jgi:hypothetical protein